MVAIEKHELVMKLQCMEHLHLRCSLGPIQTVVTITTVN